MKKLCLVFPGIGYHCDKPLLYFSKRLAAQAGYEVIEVPYKNFQSGVKGNADKMRQSFEAALEQAEEILKEIDFAAYEEILCLAKSVGTCVCAAFANRHGLKTRNVYYTPVEQTLPMVKNEGIFFTGTKDPWVEPGRLAQNLKELGMPFYVYEDANHSLETGDAVKDLENLKIIMEITKAYL